MVINVEKGNNQLIWLAKLAVTLSLLAIILTNINWESLGEALTKIKAPLLFFVFMLAFVNVVVSAEKWIVLLKPYNVALSHLLASRFYFISFFLNNFFPGSIGGDGYKIFKIFKMSNSKAAAFIPVFMERLSGFAILVLLGGIGGAYQYSIDRDIISLGSAAIGCGFTLGILFFYCLVSYKDKILSLHYITRFKKIRDILDKIFTNILAYKRYPTVILNTIIITVLFYAILLYTRYLLITALGEEIPIAALMAVIMISNTIAMLPISINGYGVLDLSFIHLLSNFGVSYESAVLVMLLHRCILLSLSIFGGLLYAFSPDRGSITKVSKN